MREPSVTNQADALIQEALLASGCFRVIAPQFAGVGSDPAAWDANSLAGLRRRGIDYGVTGTLTGTDILTKINLMFVRTDTGEMFVRTDTGETLPFTGRNITTPHVHPIIRQLLVQIKNNFCVRGSHASSDSSRHESETIPAHRETIVVEEFKNCTGEDRLDYIGKILAEGLTTSLPTRLTHFRIVERAQFDRILALRGMESAPIFEFDPQDDSPRLWGARYLLSGSFQKVGAFYRIDARIDDVRTGEVISGEAISGTGEDDAVFMQLREELEKVFLRALDQKRYVEANGLDGLKISMQTAEYAPMGAYHLLSQVGAPFMRVSVRNDTGASQQLELVAKLSTASKDGAIADLTLEERKSLELFSGDEKPVDLYPSLLPGKLREITESSQALVELSVLHRKGGVIYQDKRAITLLPYDTFVFGYRSAAGEKKIWSTISAWVSGSISGGDEVMRTAAVKAGGAIIGYKYPPEGGWEGREKDWARQQVEAIYEALREREIVYVNQPLQYPEGSSQKVIPAAKALEKRMANCLDGSVLFASLLYKAEFHPIIVIAPGHAYVGWETWSRSSEFVFLETTMLGVKDEGKEGGGGSFQSAVDAGLRRASADMLGQELLKKMAERREGIMGLTPVYILDISVLKPKMGDMAL